MHLQSFCFANCCFFDGLVVVAIVVTKTPYLHEGGVGVVENGTLLTKCPDS